MLRGVSQGVCKSKVDFVVGDSECLVGEPLLLRSACECRYVASREQRSLIDQRLIRRNTSGITSASCSASKKNAHTCCQDQEKQEQYRDPLPNFDDGWNEFHYTDASAGIREPPVHATEVTWLTCAASLESQHGDLGREAVALGSNRSVAGWGLDSVLSAFPDLCLPDARIVSRDRFCKSDCARGWSFAVWMVWRDSSVAAVRISVERSLAACDLLLHSAATRGIHVLRFLFFENLLYSATYMCDARAMALPLVTAGDSDFVEHDWHTIFSKLNVLSHDTAIGGTVRFVGWCGMIGTAVWFCWRSFYAQAQNFPETLAD